jgi:protocatechuate 3,4-dioxygenase beta subunit
MSMPKIRKVSFLGALACLAFFRISWGQINDESSTQLYWIFLTSGRSTEGVSRDDVSKMQEAHLANFARLAKQGKLTTAGPMRDPEGVLRGIVIVKAASRSAVDRMFDQDPYVAQGFMKIEAQKARIDHGQIVSNVTSESLDEFRIVVFGSREQAGEAEQNPIQGQTSYATDLCRAGKILFMSTMLEPGMCRFVWIARERDDLKQLVEASPAVADRGLEYQIIPLYLLNGSLEEGEGPLVTRREPIVGGPCERCEAVFEGIPSELSAIARIAPAEEPGEPMRIEGRVCHQDGSVAPGTVVYAYHTNAEGIYPRDDKLRGQPAYGHGKLRSWVQADKDGRYRFDTVRPGGYPNSEMPQHVHMHVIEPGRCTYYIDDIVFEDDPRLTAEKRDEYEHGRGGTGVTRPERDQGVWLVKRDIILGARIPDYPP